MKPKEKAQFFMQLAMMSRGGLPLSKAFATLEPNMPSPMVRAIRKSIDDGQSIEQAFDRKEFEAFEQSYISAGSQTGQLGASFAALADFWQRESDLATTISQSLRYPIFLVHAAVLLPPIYLLVLYGVVAYLVRVGISLGLLYGALFLLMGMLRGLWQNPAGQRRLLGVPIIGSFWKSVYILRWVQILRMEFNAGLRLPQAAADAWLGSGSADGKAHAEYARNRLHDGATLSELVPEWPLVPKDWKSYLMAAESSGQMSSTLEFLAQESEKEYVRHRQSVVEWVPKIFTILILLGVAGYILHFWSNYYQQLNNLGNQ